MKDDTPAALNTPIMKQYFSLKAKNPEAFLFFRLGDFYEMFDEDARRAAPLLELTLTQRQGVAMCGMPHHALSNHLGKLIKRGFSVAIAEQMEDPATAKGMVARDVVRVVTPGTVLEDELLSARENNFLSAVWPSVHGRGWGFAWVDMSTGELVYTDFEPGAFGQKRLMDEWGRLAPRETLWPQGVPRPDGKTLTEVNSAFFLDEKNSLALVDKDTPARPALNALRCYIKKNQPAALAGLRPPRRHDTKDFMILDEDAVQRLDLFSQPSSLGGGPSSVWDLLDHTQTAVGGRRLRRWLLSPLLSLSAIHDRQNRVDHFFQKTRERQALVEVLRDTADLERILSRWTAGSATGRDLNALRRTLRRAPIIENILGFKYVELPETLISTPHPLESWRGAFQVPRSLVDLLENALTEDPPLRLSEGGVIRDGYNADLDALRDCAKNGRGWISDLENAEKQRTGIGSLKVGFTSVFGYYLEVSRTNLPRVPPEWIRKQTLANAERFITPELKAQEDKILGADEKARALERELLMDLRGQVLVHREDLYALADALADVDAVISLATAAERGRWTKPTLHEGYEFSLEKSRHPLVERVLETKGVAFVPNDVDLGDASLLIVTGPNMGGKSTYLRQVALASVLAQMGSFVPAQRARLSLVDQVFTRIGAGDNLATGASTFLVEMKEVANVLRNATDRSLVILDEVGRGTSTYDGLAVAGAVVEFLASDKNGPGPKTLFATHYFELTTLVNHWKRVRNFHAVVREWVRPNGSTELVFLHQILPGPADRSYGVHVAQMAGLPESVVQRAKTLLSSLEAGIPSTETPREVPVQMEWPVVHPVIDLLKGMNTDRMTPLEALGVLADLKRKIEEESKA